MSIIRENYGTVILCLACGDNLVDIMAWSRDKPGVLRWKCHGCQATGEIKGLTMGRVDMGPRLLDQAKADAPRWPGVRRRPETTRSPVAAPTPEVTMPATIADLAGPAFDLMKQRYRAKNDRPSPKLESAGALLEETWNEMYGKGR